MALETIESGAVLELSRHTLGLPSQPQVNSDYVDDIFLAALVRHSAGFLCPCSAATLRSVALDSLQHLVVDENLAIRIEDIIEMLIIGGDLLELCQATTNDPTVRGTWLFAAPPSYVVRPSGNIFLTGIVADQYTYLPGELSKRIRFEGCSRVIVPDDGEDLTGELSELGLQRISENNWLKFPRAQQAEKLYTDFKVRMQTGQRSGSITDLEVLDPEKPVMYYRGRWISAKKQTGVFVARRPQEYGSPIWCFVELQNGEAQKLLDLPLPKQRWRGCDTAWHLQMAIDHLRGNPQLYSLSRHDNAFHLDFFSPLPLWAQRRLMIIGRKIAPQKCLMSFHIPAHEMENEVRFLQERLWLSPRDEEESA